jgi:hypothetical protein
VTSNKIGNSKILPFLLFDDTNKNDPLSRVLTDNVCRGCYRCGRWFVDFKRNLDLKVRAIFGS